jgi:hypothetical protein
MPEDPLKINLPIAPGVTLDMNALWRMMTSKKELPNPVLAVAVRFLKVFEWHGVRVTQIPYLLPQVTLDRLVTLESLLPVLNGETLDQTAALFGVQREWLDGVRWRMYESVRCYKQPQNFFATLAGVDFNKVFNICPLKAVYSTPLTARPYKDEPIVLVLREFIREIGDTTVYKYTICDDWDWSYPKTRLQLKALIRLAYTVFGIEVVPLFQVEKKVLKGMADEIVVPGDHVYGPCTTDPSLEDYISFPDEHPHAKECDELPVVLDLIERYELEALAIEYKELHDSLTDDDASQRREKINAFNPRWRRRIVEY